jgi:hypothetical protein
VTWLSCVTIVIMLKHFLETCRIVGVEVQTTAVKNDAIFWDICSRHVSPHTNYTVLYPVKMTAFDM